MKSQDGNKLVMENIEEENNNMKRRESKAKLKYQELLILAYFKAHYKKYEFNEILKIMGMTYAELKNTIECLIEINYLTCYGNYIILTKIGENILIDARLEDFFDNTVGELKVKKHWDIDEPYIPIGFKI